MPDAPPLRVDIVSDVVCPWCVIGYYQLAKAARDTGVELDLHWQPFELNPEMAEGGENLRDHLASKYGTTLEGSIQARARLTEMGAALGFTFNYADDMRMYNTFCAHQLIDWAAEQGKGHEMKQALFSAFFTHREDISDIKVLADAAAGIGLNHADAQAMLQSRDRTDRIRQKEQYWISRGVQGVPAMVFDHHHLVTGAQGEENYARILLHLRDNRAA
ncbi:MULTISPECIES: DsbA family oxidoreductase [unclassified Ruegeria]|uniref:DsbA family oxidoreductase n=1 Tax=unclassified Ruegeria TaxID=2625375 RepID=UPI0014891351|nr:DsbA family oxidoreductase [Ruegeria sp. HKCCD4332]NOD86871.1 DsbA family oxidoreductase [Ruegeria sp. HKCCD4318]NOE12426.1 DsbA family oxidoreductase [Ruegeria sp. HKCCD4318-2]NOG09409.1 DsbA family oxidoreductase [Ruegeria sp. HKCCD4315]